MKTLATLISLLFVIMAGCSSTYQASGTYDDIYYTPSPTAERVQEQAEVAEVRTVEVTEYEQEVLEEQPEEDAKPVLSESYFEEDGDYYVNNYYGSYYDYAYASRLRRFHHPYSFGYYDPFYTNMYWYNYNPHYFGVSIYMGYGALPLYYPGYHWSLGYAPSWAYMYYPNYSWGYGSFWSGYHAGFYSGYNYGSWGSPYYYQYRYNSYDSNNYLYGHRGSSGGRVAAGTGREGDRSRSTFAETFESRTRRTATGNRVMIASESGRRQPDAARESSRERQPAQRINESNRGREQAPVTRPQAAPERESARPQSAPVRETPRTRPTPPERRQPERTAPQQQQPVRNTQPQRRPNAQEDISGYEYSAPQRSQADQSQRYTRPQPVPSGSRNPETDVNASRPRTYTSPSYQQPRSNQQYSSPGRAPSGSQARPSQPQQRPQARPAQRNSPEYSAPSRQPSRNATPRVSSPSRTPSRSTPPARSTPSRVSPSRSSGSSSGTSTRSSSSGSSTRSSSSSRNRNR
ncbi:MAG: hypothetical protein R6U64_03325 [Bacteroidales bacterium]